MSKKYIIFEPFSGENSYIENMKRCWGYLYEIIPQNKADNNIFFLLNTKAIVLNWVESNLTLEYKKHLIWYKLLGIRIIWVFHNRMPHSTVVNPEQIKTAKKNMKFMARVSDIIIIHSQNSMQYLMEFTNQKRKIFYVPHIDYERQFRWETDEAINTEHKFRFVFQGKISPYKNIELLIKAFKELNLPQCQLCIAGSPYCPAYGEKISKLCGEADILLKFKFLTDREVGQEIRNGDILVLPYDLRSSMNSGAMLTSFSNKRTVIVSNNAMAQDYKGQDFLYIYDYSDASDHCEQLKKAMKIAYDNGAAFNRENGKRAYEYTRKHNSDPMVVQSLKKIVEEGF